jgi:hypothetical protein
MVLMYGLMIQELLESKSITSVFETYSTFVEQAINAFLCADVSGGS